MNAHFPNHIDGANPSRERTQKCNAQVLHRSYAAIRCADWLLFSVIVCLAAGCATDPSRAPHSFPPPPSEAVRVRLNPVLVVSAISETKSHFAKPYTKGQAVGAGALTGMLAAGEALAQSSQSGIAIPLEIVVLPFGAVVGAIIGSFHGTSKREIIAAEKTLTRAFSDIDFQMALRRELVEAGRKNTQRVFFTVDEAAPALTNGQPGALLEVTVLSAGLAGKGKEGAPLTMFLRIQVRLLNSAAEPPLYSHVWVQTSGARPFAEWAANDSRAFREELGKASRAAAESIIEELFLAYRPPRT